MAHDVIFKCQYFTAVSDAQIAQLQSAPETLKSFLNENPSQGLDRYWQAVQYLITGEAVGVEEPLRWFSDGGEVIGSNDAGSIRYLSSDQVAGLAGALADESPDELGHTSYDEASMDAAGVYPERWVRDGETYDQLGTARELYSYVRDFLIEQKSLRNGVIIYLKDELAFTEEDDEAAPPAPAASVTPDVQPKGEVVLVAADGGQFTRADASANPNVTAALLRQADTAMTKIGFRHLGDFRMARPDVLRTYMSADRTMVAIAYFGDRGLGSWTLLAPLESGALVVASTAFTREIKKVKLFALSLSRAEPAELHASVVERRALLEKKQGSPVVLEQNLAAAAGVWDSYGEKSRIGPRR